MGDDATMSPNELLVRTLRSLYIERSTQKNHISEPVYYYDDWWIQTYAGEHDVINGPWSFLIRIRLGPEHIVSMHQYEVWKYYQYEIPDLIESLLVDLLEGDEQHRTRSITHPKN